MGILDIIFGKKPIEQEEKKSIELSKTELNLSEFTFNGTKVGNSVEENSELLKAFQNLESDKLEGNGYEVTIKDNKLNKMRTEMKKIEEEE